MSSEKKEVNVSIRKGISIPFIGVFGPALAIVSLILFISALYNWGAIAGWADTLFTTSKVEDDITWFIKCMRIGEC
jgi:hypothetical protein